jgi:hypothetical protein
MREQPRDNASSPIVSLDGGDQCTSLGLTRGVITPLFHLLLCLAATILHSDLISHLGVHLHQEYNDSSTVLQCGSTEQPKDIHLLAQGNHPSTKLRNG